VARRDGTFAVLAALAAAEALGRRLAGPLGRLAAGRGGSSAASGCRRW